MDESRRPNPPPAPNGFSDEGGQWLPLSSAPKDGSSVLAWSEEEKCFLTLAYDAHEPATWMAKSGEFLVKDPNRFWFWQPDPSAGIKPWARRDSGGQLRRAFALAVVLLILAFTWLGGAWMENAFDVIH